jgi:hypothetical protein
MARPLVLLGNAFIVAYAMDAGFSFLEETFRHATGSAALLSARNQLAGVVVAGALLLVPATVLSRRLPPSVLWPLALSALWLGFGAAPLPLLLERPTLDFAVSGIQLAFAGAGFLRLRALSGGRRWLLASETSRPPFSLAYSLAALGAVVFGGGVLTLAYLPLLLMTSVQKATEGFVRFDLTGIALADRHFERDDQVIRLVAMMHIGEVEAYQSLIESFSGSSTVVLAEGVTDRDDLLRVPISYEGVASALGLDTQEAIESYLDDSETSELGQRPDVRQADVDASDLHPDTITWLGWAGEIWAGEEPLEAIAQMYARYDEEPERWAVFTQDVLGRRNLHLLEELQLALVDYDRVIVPWGALHLPFLQNHVLELGFEARAETYYRLASWKRILSSLLLRSAAAGHGLEENARAGLDQLLAARAEELDLAVVGRQTLEDACHGGAGGGGVHLLGDAPLNLVLLDAPGQMLDHG